MSRMRMLEALTEENIRCGMTSKEARHAAHREFGGAEQTKETYGEQRGLPFLETLWQDMRFGAQLIAKHAALSASIVAILAVGIGVGTSLYSLIDACLMRTSIAYPVVDRCADQRKSIQPPCLTASDSMITIAENPQRTRQ